MAPMMVLPNKWFMGMGPNAWQAPPPEPSMSGLGNNLASFGISEWRVLAQQLQNSLKGL